MLDHENRNPEWWVLKKFTGVCCCQLGISHNKLQIVSQALEDSQKGSLYHQRKIFSLSSLTHLQWCNISKNGQYSFKFAGLGFSIKTMYHVIRLPCAWEASVYSDIPGDDNPAALTLMTINPEKVCSLFLPLLIWLPVTRCTTNNVPFVSQTQIAVRFWIEVK